MHAGDLWIVMTLGGAIVLGCALAYGLMRNSKRDRRLDPVGEAATRAQYDPDGTSYRPVPDQAHAAENRKLDGSA